MYDPAAYGNNCAPFYDEIYPAIEPGQLAALARLAASGRILELGLANGRVARPLALQGEAIYGIDASSAMIGECRVRNGADRVRAVLGDTTSLPFAARCFRLVFALVSTLALLPSRERLECAIKEAARVTDYGGVLLYETFACRDAAEPKTHRYPIATAAGVRQYQVTTLDTSPETLVEIASDSGFELTADDRDWLGNPAESRAGRHILIFRRS